jgi:hypothetical protein
MLSVIEVQCPHCGARGTIMVPPLGSILIGPCPLCREMVVLFSGKVMALDKEVMLTGDNDTKRKHLAEVLNVYLNNRIEEVLSGKEVASFSVDGDIDVDFDEDEQDDTAYEDESGDDAYANTELTDGLMDLGPISKEEVADFVRIDLPLLARDKYFRMFFEK